MQDFLYESVLDNLQNAVFAFNMEFNLFYANKKFQHFLSITQNESAGSEYFGDVLNFPLSGILFLKDGIPRVISFYRKARKDKKKWDKSLEVFWKRGNKHYKTIFTVLVSGDEIRGGVGHICDITDEYKLEKNLSRYQKSLNKIYSTIPGVIFEFAFTADTTNNIKGMFHDFPVHHGHFH